MVWTIRWRERASLLTSWNSIESLFSYLPIFRHSSAHLRHCSAHILQWSTLCLSHSSAHASQTLAHRSQNCFANWLSIDISDAEVQQTVAHSLLICAQGAIIFTSDSRRSEVAQNSHASAQRMHAFMQLCHFVFWRLVLLLLVDICAGRIHDINDYSLCVALLIKRKFFSLFSTKSP